MKLLGDVSERGRSISGITLWIATTGAPHTVAESIVDPASSYSYSDWGSAGSPPTAPRDALQGTLLVQGSVA